MRAVEAASPEILFTGLSPMKKTPNLWLDPTKLSRLMDDRLRTKFAPLILLLLLHRNTQRSTIFSWACSSGELRFTFDIPFDNWPEENTWTLDRQSTLGKGLLRSSEDTVKAETTQYSPEFRMARLSMHCCGRIQSSHSSCGRIQVHIRRCGS